MGARKRLAAEKRKEALKTQYLQNCKMFPLHPAKCATL